MALVLGMMAACTFSAYTYGQITAFAKNLAVVRQNSQPVWRLIRLPTLTPTLVPDQLVGTPTLSLSATAPPLPVNESASLLNAGLPSIQPGGGNLDELTPVATAPPNDNPINEVEPEVLPTPDAVEPDENSTFLSPVETPVPFDAESIDTPTFLDLSVFDSPLSAFDSPIATPTPIIPDTPYDFLINEFFNSPTTNNFLMVYVAVVSREDIPIGDMKLVGTRLDQNLTYESPLTKWFYEGYSAPGEVVKSGNTKFEPPGGIETTDWVVHLEDDHGNRKSEDIPFHVDASDKQWYFIKFHRKF